MTGQIARRFDAVTLKKIGHSALLLIGGTLTAFVGNNLIALLGATPIPAGTGNGARS